MKLLLDTDAYPALRRGHPEVERQIRAAQTIVFSVVVLGELLFGFRNGTRYRANLSKLESFLYQPAVTVLPLTPRTADHFGAIASELRKKGKPIPSNDVWIAAHTMETRAALLSFDRHFASIDGLQWIQLTNKSD